MRHLGTSSQAMTIHQYHFSVAPGDAVTNQMFFIQRSLNEAGIESRLYADHIRGGLSKNVSRLNESELWNCDILLLHHSHGNPQLPKIVQIEVPKALIYHNITPEIFFRHDPHMWNLCRIGRRQLDLLRSKVVTTFAVSRFNAAELKKMGFADPILFPLFDMPSFSEAKGHQSSPTPKGSPTDKIQLLFVGKITAHKNQAAILRVLSHLPTRYELTLVGSADPVYLDYLHLLSRALGVSGRVHLTGKVPNRDLNHIFRQSSAFVSMSLHEGFGVPLLEAMAYELPVFAYHGGAVSETLGNAGVLLKTLVPWKIAQCLRAFLEKPEAISRVLESQAARLDAVKLIQNRERVWQICRDLVHHLRLIPECEWKNQSRTIAKRLDA